MSTVLRQTNLEYWVSAKLSSIYVLIIESNQPLALWVQSQNNKLAFMANHNYTLFQKHFKWGAFSYKRFRWLKNYKHNMHSNFLTWQKHRSSEDDLGLAKWRKHNSTSLNPPIISAVTETFCFCEQKNLLSPQSCKLHIWMKQHPVTTYTNM